MHKSRRKFVIGIGTSLPNNEKCIYIAGLAIFRYETLQLFGFNILGIIDGLKQLLLKSGKFGLEI